jgi:homoserine O-acetyltransferase
VTSGQTRAELRGRSIGLVETQSAVLFDEARPLLLESGAQLAPVEVAYETYGELNTDRSNAVFICHALTGDAHAAGHHGDPARPGWWDNLIGPGRPIDTDRFHVICANLLGGCQGSTGPGSINPATGRAYGLSFPALTVGDLVAVHRALLAHLGVDRLAAAVGGSVGGMQVLQWALDHPEEIGAGVLICATSKLSPQNIAFSAVAREAILRDPHFHGGNYAEHGERPDNGLFLARAIAHITYLSEQSMREKFGRRIQAGDGPRGPFDADFEVESYLQHQGTSFLERFDALSYLYLTRVMDYFDAFGGDEAELARRLAAVRTQFLVLSFDTDWRFDTEHSKAIVRTLAAHHVPVTFEEIVSPWGHDSFLLPIDDYHDTVAAFMQRVHDEVSGAA